MDVLVGWQNFFMSINRERIRRGWKIEIGQSRFSMVNLTFFKSLVWSKSNDEQCFSIMFWIRMMHKWAKVFKTGLSKPVDTRVVSTSKRRRTTWYRRWNDVVCLLGNFVEDRFKKFYLVHSWIFCLKYPVGARFIFTYTKCSTKRVSKTVKNNWSLTRSIHVTKKSHCYSSYKRFHVVASLVV